MPDNRLADLALIAIAGALLALAAVHVLTPELDPRWSVLSQYSLASHGWLMSATFLAFAIACASAAMILRRHGGRRGTIGAILLFIAALGLVLAAFFHIDPLDTPPEAMTAGAMLHNLASLLGNVGLIGGALLLTGGLRKVAAWRGVRHGLLVAANLAWIGIVLMVLCIAMVVQGGGNLDGPWYVGLANRVVFLSELAWLALAVWPVRAASVRSVGA